MKVLFFLAVLANVVLFMWEFQHGGFESSINRAQQSGLEPMVLVSELAMKDAGAVDFVSLYPPGWDPLGNNLLSEQIELEDFTGELLLTDEPQDELDAEAASPE